MNKEEYDQGYRHGGASTQDQARGSRDAAREQQKRQQEGWDRFVEANRQQRAREQAAELQRIADEKLYRKQQEERAERQRHKQQLKEDRLRETQIKEAQKEQSRIAHQQKLDKKKPQIREKKGFWQNRSEAKKIKLGSKAARTTRKPRWRWIAAIPAFIIATLVLMSNYRMESGPAMFLGGIVGIIFGYWYRQLFIIGALLTFLYILFHSK